MLIFNKFGVGYLKMLPPTHTLGYIFQKKTPHLWCFQFASWENLLCMISGSDESLNIHIVQINGSKSLNTKRLVNSYVQGRYEMILKMLSLAVARASLGIIKC